MTKVPEMVERLARASFKFWRENATRKGVHLDKCQTVEDMSDSERAFALAHARAVIEAMQKPTEAMVMAATLGDEGARSEFLEAWQSAFAAALKD